jgi:hypothetical protein
MPNPPVLVASTGGFVFAAGPSAYAVRRNSSDALMPPKPKELLRR